MNSIRAQLIKNGNLIADIRTEERTGKTAAKRAARFRAAAAARSQVVVTVVKSRKQA